MTITYRTPISYRIERRTFEGRNDPSKNDDSLTSKYMPSYKYWMEISYTDGTVNNNCYVSKKDALDKYAEYQRMAGKPL